MIEAGGVFDGWGSSLISGLLGAMFVVIGVLLAQHLSDSRRAAEARQTAAHNLMIRISDLRDAATKSAEARLGDYAMFPLRNEMLVSYKALGQYPAYKVVSDFYDRVRELRSNLRSHTRTNTRQTTEDADVLGAHLDALYNYSEKVIGVLKDHLDDRDLRFVTPQLPPLPPGASSE